MSTILFLGFLGTQTAFAQKAPASISYSASSFQLFANQHVYLVPTIVGLPPGQPVNCGASALPPGLMINSSDCSITGVIPSFVPPGGISISTTVMSTFAPPIQLAFQLQNEGVQYSAANYQLFAGQAVSIFPNLVGFQPGQQVNCSASSLPMGLTLNSANCAITGQIPNYLPPQGLTFNTTIYSSIVNQPTQLTFQLSNQGIVFPQTSFTLFAGQQVSLSPKLVGFQPSQSVNCAANALPPGLQINSSNCAITGQIPQYLPPQGFSFIVNIFSPALQQPLQLSFQIANQGIVYPTTAFNLVPNQQVTIVPNLVGFQPSQPVYCSASQLPPGLQIDPNTCAITGQIPSYLPSPARTITTMVYSAALQQPIQLNFNLNPALIGSLNNLN